MRAIISTTGDDNYLYFVPLTTWCWNKIGIGVDMFMPIKSFGEKTKLIGKYVRGFGFENSSCHPFDCPKFKEATYAQCSRLFGGSLEHFPNDEILVTSDIDMLVFKMPEYLGGFTICGADLVPKDQVPICFIIAKKNDWNIAFNVGGKSYQKCLDEMLGKEDCQDMRGNLWSRDQETAYNKIVATQEVNFINRSNGKNQFATNRVDRTDSFWRDRISNELVDAHLWRPGYEPQNFANILELLTLMYPYEDFKWLVDYTEQYKMLL